MKKHLLTIATVVALVLSANAQTEKGKSFVAGGLSLSSTSIKGVDDNVSEFGIQGQYGYFINNNVAIGLGLGYADVNTEGSLNSETYSYKTSSFTIAPFARLYANTESPFKLFGQVTAQYSNGKIKDIDGYKVSGFGAAISPGFALFPTKSVSVDITFKGLYFENIKDKLDGEEVSSTSTFGLNANSFAPTLSLGFFF